MNLATILEGQPNDHVALISRSRSTTYADLRDQVARLAAGFTGQGLDPGDRLALLCGNNWYFVASYLAALSAGLVAVPLNPASPTRELAQQLAGVQARGAVVGPSGASSFRGIDGAAVEHLTSVITPKGVELPGSVPLDDLLETPPQAAPVERTGDDLAVLVFTSGTAGFPRAACLTHGNLRANIDQFQATPGRCQGSTDVVLGVLPLFHIFGLNVVLGLSLAAGSTVLLIERFDPTSAAEAIQRHGVTVVPGAPPMWAAWAASPGLDRSTFATVRLAASGAARLPVDVAETVERRLGVVVGEGYGLTEASPAVTSSAGTDAPRGSIGSPLPGVEVRLVDDDGDDVLVGDSGEIWVRGPNVFAGYWQDDDATADALTADGWLRTGDIAVADDGGNLFLVDRAKDLIIVSGFNVYPAEVEQVLLEHPAIAAAAVVGVAHPYTGEAVKAYVVVEDGGSVEEDDVISFCAERLARYKCPDKVQFTDELPQGPAGKVLRRALR